MANFYSSKSQSDYSDDSSSFSESTKSRNSSIGGPYRNGWIDRSFPYCNPIETPNDNADSFSRPLLSSGHGFPLWSPTDVNIGDVGVLDIEGTYTPFFNLFRPSHDSVQTDFTPSTFQPISPPLRENEIKRNPHQFSHGTVITSKGVSFTRASTAPLKIKFTSVAREGGAIVLPHGGEREDLISTSRLHSYIHDNALAWYQYIRDSIEEAIPNGSLYVITGCDKTASCGVASLPCRGGKAKAVYTDQDGNPWTANGNARTNYHDANYSSKSRAAFFVRGMRVSLSAFSWKRQLEYHAPYQFRPYFDVLATPVLGFRARMIVLNDKFLGDDANPPTEGIPEPFHPSDLISQMLLEKARCACVAIVEDQSWMSCVEGGDLTLPKVIDLVTKVFQRSEPFTRKGLALLEPKQRYDTDEIESSSKLCMPTKPPLRGLEDRRHVERIITTRY